MAATALVPAVPQRPLATGKIDNILPVIKAVNQCGIVSVRTEPGRAQGSVRLFVNEDPQQRSAFDCADRWIRQNAKRLDLYLDY
jgi:pyruvate/oxaloacetate carboxyltransferase